MISLRSPAASLKPSTDILEGVKDLIFNSHSLGIQFSMVDGVQ